MKKIKLKSKDNVKYFINGDYFGVKKGQVFKLNKKNTDKLLEKDKKHFEVVKKK